MDYRNVTLDDKYALVEGQALMTGIQALVRLPLDQRRLDQIAGYDTGGFISGYRGSPLGGYDQQLVLAQAWLTDLDVEFWPGLNEDMAATAVWGSQQLGLFPGARKEGLFGIWYGKAPGIDRTGDVFKHANAAGCAPLGGVLAVLGDDHNCKSSTLPSQSEFAMADAEIPVLNPANIQEVLDYGLHGLAMSRFSGAWSALTALADTMDSSSVINVGLQRHQFQQPKFEFPEDGVHIRRGDTPLEKERRLRETKLRAAQAWVRANHLDRVLLQGRSPRLGLVVTGQAARDVFEALAALGLTPAQAADLGLSIFKVAMSWPLEPTAIRTFCEGLEQVLVIEHKRPLIEDQLRAVLYDLPDSKRPRIEGKTDVSGRPLLSSVGSISLPEMARTIADRLPQDGLGPVAAAYFEKLAQQGRIPASASGTITRSPHYCSGCPHNTSTRVPEGARALAGIGCHYMANFMPDRATDMTSQMGGEGVAWLGQYFATDEKHIFVNLGDGTFSHSGSLALRAAVTSQANMTYKILYNDAVAMTGGQAVESGQTPQQIATQVRAEGVETIVIVTEDPVRYANVKDLPPRVRIYDRDDLDAVQKGLQKTPGVSVLIYDQLCATEKRRRTKRGLRAPDRTRAIINTEICEGCGDCSVQSNCLSVEPVETELGRKRRINQSTCNTDLSCLKGFCPSFVTLTDGDFCAEDAPRPKIDASQLPLPEMPDLDRPWNVVFTGVGGTGVTTVAAILAMAAHVDGQAASTLDMTGLAQKGGPVLSHLRFARTADEIMTGRVPPAGADCIIACDLVVAASEDALLLSAAEQTYVCANKDITPTSAFILDRSVKYPVDLMAGRIARGARDMAAIDAEALAMRYFNSAIFTNMIMVGYAWQKGQLPVSLRGLYRAIKLNHMAVEDNMAAFEVGRIAASAPERLEPAEDPRGTPTQLTLDDLVQDRVNRLVAYQNSAYADRYQAVIEKVRRAEKLLGLGEALSRDAAFFAYKLMAYKDEYEVARLWTDGRFERSLRETFKGGQIRFHLAPPVLGKRDSSGQPVKQAFGLWMRTVFVVLRKLRVLRGTGFDIFGWTQERRQERALRDTYLADLIRLADELTAERYDLAIKIARIPDNIRGFGHVKQKAMEKVLPERVQLWEAWERGPQKRSTLLSPVSS